MMGRWGIQKEGNSEEGNNEEGNNEHLAGQKRENPSTRARVSRIL